MNFLNIIPHDKQKLFYIVLSIVTFFSCFSLLKGFLFSEAEGEVESRSKKEYSSVSTEYLGKFLSETYPNAKALIIYNSISTSEVIERRISGLRKSLKGNIEIIKEVGVPSNVPKEIPVHMLRCSEYIKAADFNKAMKKYPQANMLITLVGLPDDVQNMKIWQIEDVQKRPKVAVYGGNLKQFSAAIKANLIHALVIYRPMDNSVNRLPPDNLEEAFNKRFRLITPQNIKNSGLVKK